MSDFKKATPTIVKVFHLHRKPVKRSIPIYRNLIKASRFTVYSAPIPIQGIHLNENCKIVLDVQMFRLTVFDFSPSVSPFLAPTHFYIMS